MSGRTLVGRLHATRFGYGFVRVEDEPEDVFVPPFAMGGALHGDRVRVGYLETREQGDAHEVVEILARTRYGIVGRLEPRGRLTALFPERPEYPSSILLALHGRKSVPRGARVLVRLDPTPVDPVQGTVAAVFEEDDPREDSLLVAMEEGLRVEFDPDAEREADAFGEESVQRAARGREDFRGETVLTIDPADAKDHDDALSLRGDPERGPCDVAIHIADVTHYVRPGSALDREAEERGCSVYLADRALPMLPHALSAGLCSLSEGVDRLTVTVIATLAPDGAVLGTRVAEGIIRSAASLSYEEAAGILAARGDGAIPVSLRGLDRLARALRERRFEQGGLDLDVPEVRPALDAAGEPVAFRERPRLPTHGLIEEFMLLANQVVGRRALAREAPFLYRIHERPRYDRLRAFFEAARYLGRSGPSTIVTDARQLRRWVTHGTSPRDRMVALYLLRAMEKARYDLVDVGHFGLGMRGYAHFTSPIRRYPDLANHRVVKRYLTEAAGSGRGDPWVFADGWLNARVAARSSEAEIAADDAERAVSKRKAVRFALQRIGEEARGYVSGLTPNGLFVAIEAWNIEGFLPKRALGDPSLTLAEHGFAFRSRRSRRRYGLGDPLVVAVARADLARREVELALAAPASGRKQRTRRPEKKGRRHPKRR
ncbi:MAG: ribonuclease R family protein [Hyphomicrobiales bacterium]